MHWICSYSYLRELLTDCIHGQNNPEGDVGDGTTICAPYGHRCAGKKVGSEQDWQGQGHTLLNTRLKAHFVMHGLPKPTNNDGVAFRFRLLAAAQGAAQVQATRIYYLDAAGNQQHTGQLGSNNTTNGTAPSANASFPDNGPSSRIRRSSHGHGVMQTQTLREATDNNNTGSRGTHTVWTRQALPGRLLL